MLYIHKALTVIDSELELIRLRMHSPELSPIKSFQPFQSSLSVVPRFQNLGIMGMTELLTALMLLGGIIDKSGKKPTTIAFAEVFEQVFGFSFNDIYDRQSELFRRKSCNLTKTLDALKAALIKEYRQRQKEGRKVNMEKDDYTKH